MPVITTSPFNVLADVFWLFFAEGSGGQTSNGTSYGLSTNGTSTTLPGGYDLINDTDSTFSLQQNHIEKFFAVTAPASNSTEINNIPTGIYGGSSSQSMTFDSTYNAILGTRDWDIRIRVTAGGSGIATLWITPV